MFVSQSAFYWTQLRAGFASNSSTVIVAGFEVSAGTYGSELAVDGELFGSQRGQKSPVPFALRVRDGGTEGSLAALEELDAKVFERELGLLQRDRLGFFEQDLGKEGSFAAFRGGLDRLGGSAVAQGLEQSDMMLSPSK